MRISKESLMGYLLEEALAFLIRNTGYKLLVHESQDPTELKNRGNGLVVKGRGGEHQADVLGQLLWIPAFTYPIRIFVEAKFRQAKTGIDVVRNAVGITDDLNQNYLKDQRSGLPVKRYSYNYAIFSTSGFSKNAVDMATAHQISLIDLSGSEFYSLREVIKDTATRIISSFQEDDEFAASSEEMEDGSRGYTTRSNFVRTIRHYLRSKFNILPEEVSRPYINLSLFNSTAFEGIFEEMIDVIKKYNELFVGMANGPFLLVLKSDDPKKFRDFAINNPTHQININESYPDNNLLELQITPYGRDDYKLWVTLPEVLRELIFKNTREALNIKEQYFSDITIYSINDEKDEIIRLKYRV
ncbi:PDDEXK family nuclease [Calidifontibacillus oryziterrae]|uniref:hypothetical protein n=1 Tax=Calidifontibacillus oryziterrae TaxID=1191699 RepID=UPI0002FF8BC6|nr:hypothetical protein [Calidifontibacillus oryziterrae]